MFDLPKHCPMSVNSDGNGPLDDSDPNVARLDCWCAFGMPWPHPGSDSGESEYSV